MNEEQTSYLSKLKKKYNIQDGPKSTLILPEEFEKTQERLRMKIKNFFREHDSNGSYNELLLKILAMCFSKEEKYRLIDISSELIPGILVKIIAGDGDKLGLIDGVILENTRIGPESAITVQEPNMQIRKIKSSEVMIMKKYNPSELRILDMGKLIIKNKNN